MTIAAIFFNAIILPITRFVNEDFCRIWQKSSVKCVSSIEKTGYPPIDIKFADRLAYYDAFDDAHEKQGVEAMEKLFAKYLNERLDMYLRIQKDM